MKIKYKIQYLLASLLPALTITLLAVIGFYTYIAFEYLDNRFYESEMTWILRRFLEFKSKLPENTLDQQALLFSLRWCLPIFIPIAGLIYWSWGDMRRHDEELKSN